MFVHNKKVLVVENDEAIAVLRALASDTRVLILSLLTYESTNVATLAAALDIPLSTLNFNVRQLQEAGLIDVAYEPGTRGTQKLLRKRYDEVTVRLPGVTVQSAADGLVELALPVGAYRGAEVRPSCGLLSDTRFIGVNDDPRSFQEAERAFAQLLWFQQGYVEYAFHKNVPFGATLTELEFSAELCSEAPDYNLDWPSDITLSVNGVDVGTWTSPADYGGRRGHLTPPWWPPDQTMYGELKTWTVTPGGTLLDGAPCSAVTLADLNLAAASHIAVRLGVKSDARHVGGLNLFGGRCGDHPQDLLLRLRYTIR
ncbi:transcriptional regulator (plasmid) [Deinococcus aetherius]|uniref:Transcriptional regulator n=1 Tax=Deinococcus aetherius TaxID=200252 RepID=A0ABN6RK95_9DEIO|nr:helix-turn-helix domain-containing protein [Deinococcus aetherius]BDP43723.1 transcriptional regulator [Deinococcus aetherius]